ncbi:MAG: glycosyltransferase, partial [bacterium]|nr:glycosyltransferase [bacterium]
MSDLPTILIATLIAISAMYAAVLSGFLRGMARLKQNRSAEPNDWPSLSVILPARNEAAVLELTLRSLFKQDYPGEWEIIVVDDRSTDNTPQILTALSAETPRLRSLRITEARPRSPKKNALAAGIRAAHGSIIVTTDADCTYDPGWLRGMISHFTPDVGIVAGLTVFDLPDTPAPVWQKIQWLDFVIQQFLAAGAVGRGVPSSCNGSNLAYRRKVYEDISGFGTSSR